MPTKRYNIKTDKALQALLAHLRGIAQPFNIAISDGEKRSIDQNRRMWAMLGEISQKATHYGRKLTPNGWKCLFMAGLAEEKGDDVCIMPSLSGRSFVHVSERSSEMNIAEMGDLMTFMEAWCAENNVILTDPRLGDERNAT